MGGVPRTKTGLVPASYRQQIDTMSTPDKWGHLPSKPKPEMYPYRGDYVNERNRRLAQERKIAQKQKQPLLDKSNDERDSCGSTLLVTPRSGDGNSSILAPDTSKKWDSYCQHISCVKLSDEEECKRVQNRDKYLSYMRAEASKRRDRMSLAKKKKGPDQQQNDVQPAVRKRKPPVPRLSRLARSGGNKENRSNGSKTSSSTSKESGPNGSESGKEKPNTKTKVRYLDFISEKSKGSSKPSPNVKITSGKRPGLDEEESDDEDESKFRSQIERIVERAAEMVLKEQHEAQENSHGGEDTNECTHQSRDDSSPDFRSDGKESKNEELACVCYTHEQDIVQKQSQLGILEERLMSVASSTIDESATIDSSHLENVTNIDHANDQQDYSRAINAILEDGEVNSFSTGTEIVPRVHIQPMGMPAWPVSHQGGCESMSDIFKGLDSSSCTSSHPETEVQSTTAFSDTRPSDSASSNQYECGTLSTDGFFSVSVSGAQTQQIHTLSSELSILPQPCPEESVPQPAHPTSEPFREFQSLDEEPLPRGYEKTPRPSQTSVNESGRKLSAGCSGNDESIVDDLFSLL
ncbi:hypothetical protein ACHAWF_018861 [Thalassiosira exigua]